MVFTGLECEEHYNPKPVFRILTAVVRFVRSITTVIHGVTFPPERDALISFALKLEKKKKVQ